MNTKLLILTLLLFFIVGCGSTKYGDFAKCLGQKNVKFYGVFWCSHCQNQKKLFGSSAKLLPYTECSTPDGKGQLQACIDKKIMSYPTWEFSDKSRLTGELSLQALSQKSGCALPK